MSTAWPGAYQQGFESYDSSAVCLAGLEMLVEVMLSWQSSIVKAVFAVAEYVLRSTWQERGAIRKLAFQYAALTS